MKRINVLQPKALLKVFAVLVPLLLNGYGIAAASTEQLPGVSRNEVAAVSEVESAHGTQSAPEEEKAGDVIMHHILNNRVFSFPPFGSVELPEI